MDINEIIAASIEHNASDILLSPESSPFLRIDGDLIKLSNIKPLASDTIRNILYTELDEKQIKTLEKKHTLDCIIELTEKNIRVRTNIVEQQNGIAAALRIIPEIIPTLDEIGTPLILKNLATLPSGLILIAGPEGSGKSTTLSALINYMNSHQARHIITLEDPIEYVYQNKKSLINQRQISNKSTFSDDLRTALRGNPDVLVVGEMRDRDTVRLALTAAETGQLVISTIHASSSSSAIRRMIDVFPSGEKEIIRSLIASVFQAVIYQILIKKIAGGRIAAFEILLGTQATRNLINYNNLEQLNSTMEMSQEKGMCTINAALKKLLNNHIITHENMQNCLIDTESTVNDLISFQ